MREAPESVVRAVMEALGCEGIFGPNGAECGEHRFWGERGCTEAVEAADAAWASAYPEALRDAGERLDALTAIFKDGSKAYATAYTLRRWADESEA